MNDMKGINRNSNHPFLKLINSYEIPSPRPINLADLLYLVCFTASWLTIQFASYALMCVSCDYTILEGLNSAQDLLCNCLSSSDPGNCSLGECSDRLRSTNNNIEDLLRWYRENRGICYRLRNQYLRHRYISDRPGHIDRARKLFSEMVTAADRENRIRSALEGQIAIHDSLTLRLLGFSPRPADYPD